MARENLAMEARTVQPRGHRGMAMEGIVARRYAKLRRTESQAAERQRQAARLTAALPDHAEILEVAPGPGDFAVELARRGKFRVTGLDLSRTFVGIARENAATSGVVVDFQEGDVAAMPFEEGSFDLVVCQAAFKNFSRPLNAIAEMYRVLRPGGTAVIQDLRADASDAAIRHEVESMRLGRLGASVTRWILGRLRRRAYTREQFELLAEASDFGACDATTSEVGVEIRLTKRANPVYHRHGLGRFRETSAPAERWTAAAVAS